tara:strand:- start:328 stop:519 length:192 start_codon:yes stop_codon:yes gene_type:complete
MVFLRKYNVGKIYYTKNNKWYKTHTLKTLVFHVPKSWEWNPVGIINNIHFNAYRLQVLEEKPD